MRGGDGEAVGADLVGGVAVRGDPVGSGDDAIDLPERHQMRRGRIRDHRVRDPERLELPGGQPRALEERPRLVDEHDREQIRAPTPSGARRPPSRSRSSRARRRCSESARASPARRARRRARTSAGNARPPPRAARARARATGSSRICSSAQTRLTAVGREPASTRVRVVEILPALGRERVAVCGGDSDRRRTSHGQRPDRGSATSAAVVHRSSTSSSGSRRWSRRTTAPGSSRTIRSGVRSAMSERSWSSYVTRRDTSEGLAPDVSRADRCDADGWATSPRPRRPGTSPAPRRAGRSRSPSSRA